MSKSAVRFQQRINRAETRLAPNNGYYKKKETTFSTSARGTPKKKSSRREKRLSRLEWRDSRLNRIESILAQYPAFKAANPAKQARMAPLTPLIIFTWKNLEALETGQLDAEYTEKLALCRTYLQDVNLTLARAPQLESSQPIAEAHGSSDTPSPSPSAEGQPQPIEQDSTRANHLTDGKTKSPKRQRSPARTDSEFDRRRSLDNTEPSSIPKPNRRSPAGPVPPAPDSLEPEETLAKLREIFRDGKERDRDALIAELALAHGWKKVGANIRSTLERHLLLALHRNVLEKAGRHELRLAAKSIDRYPRDFVKKQFLVALGPGWVERDEAIRRFARHLGFQRAKKRIRESAKSIIRGLAQQKRIQIEGRYVRTFSTSPKGSPRPTSKQSANPGSRKSAKVKHQPKPAKKEDDEMIRALQEIRDLFSDGEPRVRGEAIAQVARELEIPLTLRNHSLLDSAFRAASRNGIIQRSGQKYRLVARIIDGYNPNFLKEQLPRLIGRDTITRQEAARRLARALGFRRTGDRIKAVTESLIRSLIREKLLYSDRNEIERL